MTIRAASAAAVGFARNWVPRIVGWVDIGETQWPDRADLRDILAGLGPMEMGLVARQNQYATRRVRCQLCFVELFTEPDVEDPDRKSNV